MDTRTVGVEEELLVIDPVTRSVTARARAVVRENDEHGRGTSPRNASDELDKELFRHQLEIRTDPTRDVDDTVAQIVAGRRTAGEAAAVLELAVAVSASVPLALEEPVVSDNERYLDMAEAFGQVARRGTTCGMHVHVAIDSPEEGVGCIDRITPWLPVLLAASTNSPFEEGRDTGYASWRTQLWSTWPSAGPTEPFGSCTGYRRACELMIASGAARDPGMFYFDARLSLGQPTLEVRSATGSTRQRAAYERTGSLEGVVDDLLARTRDSWASPNTADRA